MHNQQHVQSIPAVYPWISSYLPRTCLRNAREIWSLSGDRKIPVQATTAANEIQYGVR